MFRNMLSITLLLLSPALLAADAVVFGLGDLPLEPAALKWGQDDLYFSQALAITPDASVVVGISSAPRYRAFQWTEKHGMVMLPYPDHVAFMSPIVSAISADGSTVVGLFQQPGAHTAKPFVWRQDTGMQFLLASDINQRANGHFFEDYGMALAVSGDGSVVVGEANKANTITQAFIWHRATGRMKALRTLGGDFSSASWVSADGSVVMGTAENAEGKREVFRWTEATGMVRADDQRQGIRNAQGVVMAGTHEDQAVRWLADGTRVPLGQREGFDKSRVTGANADGTVIVGYLSSSQGSYPQQWLSSRAFRWTEETGLQLLDEWLDNMGVDHQGWRFWMVSAISADGKTLVGSSGPGHDEWGEPVPDEAWMIKTCEAGKGWFSRGCRKSSPPGFPASLPSVHQ